MTKLFEVYKCGVCGNTVMVVGASGALWCAAGSLWYPAGKDR